MFTIGCSHQILSPCIFAFTLCPCHVQAEVVTAEPVSSPAISSPAVQQPSSHNVDLRSAEVWLVSMRMLACHHCAFHFIEVARHPWSPAKVDADLLGLGAHQEVVKPYHCDKLDAP